jgi:methionyl aminopeptidase
MQLIKTKDMDGARRAAECVVKTHQALAAWLKPGQTLAEVDAKVASILESLDSRSAFLGYKAKPHPSFPSHACLSVNECIVHGTHDMNDTPLREGDIFSIDIGALHEGWIGDAAWTYAICGADSVGKALMAVGKGSLDAGIQAMQPGRPLLDWARAVQEHVETIHDFKLVRGLGGHGYGRTLHGPPFISNVVPSHPAEWSDAFKSFKPGLLVAVEPMLSTTTGRIRTNGRKWPIYTADNSLSVHYEADILIGENGPENLTADLFDLPDAVGN